jgi:TRAP-type C4-dicarboxylate transport system substrate-binding protein
MKEKRVFRILMTCLGLIVAISLSNPLMAKTVVLKAEHDEPAGSITDKILHDMSGKVLKVTQGRVKMQVFAGCQLSGGKIKTMIQNTTLGSTHLSFISAATFTAWDMNIGVCNLPFLVEDYDGYEKLRHTAPMRDLLDDWEKIGLKGVDYWTRALRQVVNTRRRILTTEDIKGLRFRVMETPLYVSIFKALDAHPIGMPFGEIFTALKLGTIDGAERPTEFLLTEKWWDLAKYVTMWDYTGDLLVVAANPKFFNKLEKQDQEALVKLVTEGGDEKYQAEKKMQEDAVKKLREKGMVVDFLDPKEKAKFREKTQVTWKIFEPKFEKGLIDRVVKALKE